MNIAVISPYVLKTGGISTYVAELVKAYSKSGHNVTLLSNDLQQESPGRLPDFFFPRILAATVRLFRQRPRFVHVHSQIHMLLSALFYRVFFKDVSVIFTFHTQPYIAPSLPISKPEKPTYRGVNRFFARFMLSRCDCVTAVSESIFINIERTCGIVLTKKVVVPSGVPELRPSSKTGQSLKLPSGRPLFSTVGVLAWDWKVAGQKICIEAMPAILREYPDAILAIAGNTDGSYYEYLKDVVNQNDLGDNVMFLGSIKHVNELLESSDIYFHMALYEASPIAVLEAMSHGKPIIAVNSGGIPGVIRDNSTGILIPPNPEMLASKTIELLKNKDFAVNLGSAAKNYVREHHNWSDLAGRYLALVPN